jgi:beta-glucuronidase
MKAKLLIFVMLLFPSALLAQTGLKVLEGNWTFALDPVNVGVKDEWFQPDLPIERWDQVTVPHCFSVDPRYYRYTGTAWYFKRFPKIQVPDGYRAVIRFEAVFYKAQVWLNGEKVGEHEGGYTPFELDITEGLSEKNALALRVNNAWDTTTIPGAKTRVPYQGENMAQMFPWINYGGITRPVKLILRPEAYISNVRVEATPDLKNGTAHVRIAAFIKNDSDVAMKKNDLRASVYQSGREIKTKFRITGEDAGPGRQSVVHLEATLASKDVRLWNIDEPVLYAWEVIAGKDTARAAFGIRKVEIRGTKLLLNGEPISLGGCNRPLDYPGYGSMDPPHVLEQDLTLIKSAGMELSRISHYPVSSEMLDWADRHGMLIIAEAGNWQMTPKQLSDPLMRAKFQSQMKEMIERDWNHPSVIAWSVGNEYQSQTEEGKSWTRDMYAFTKSIDPSRLVTFATNIAGRSSIQRAEDEASRYVDFISANIYGGHLRTLQHIHELYPDKPIYVSEFGVRADLVKSEDERVAYLKRAMNDFRQCDFVIGASVWTFNDYQSSFPGTNINGYRPFGLVSPQRELREMYFASQEEFSPATISIEGPEDGKLRLVITARKDFPSYTLRNYKVRVADQLFEIPVLRPGESKTLAVDLTGATGDRTVELVKPGNFVILKKSY